MSASTYEYRKANGLCVYCGSKAIDGKVSCESCSDRYSKTRKEEREFLKAIHICPRCKKNKLFGSEKNCPECLASMAEINAKSREKNQNYKQEEHERYLKRKQYKKEHGLCYYCNNPVFNGTTQCEKHLIKNRNRAKQRNVEKGLTRDLRVQYGLCYICGHPLDTDTNLCSKCRDRAIRNFANLKSDGKYWNADNKIAFKQN